VNHPEAWPAAMQAGTGTMTLGTETFTMTECMAILKRPTRGDCRYSMAAQLIATKLNLARGTEASCINSTVKGGSRVTTWDGGETTHNTLDDYNNGRLCAPHMN
jgi:hypothetical protein